MPTFQAKVDDGQIILDATIGDPPTLYSALLDTGAQSTMVSPKVVKEACLTAIGYAQVVPVSGEPIRTRRHRVKLGIPVKQGSAVLLAGGELEVAELPFQPTNFDILLGMDFLMAFHVTLYGGSFILSN